MTTVYISLGSNLGNAAQNLANGIGHIKAQIGTLQQKSSIYQTAPWGFESFNNFLNQVVAVTTHLSAVEVMQSLLQIEQDMGRNRTSDGYSDRIIDLDILLIDDCILKTKELEIPHPRMHLRNFVLLPLAEIAPTLIHPVFLKSIALLTQQCLDQTKATKI